MMEFYNQITHKAKKEHKCEFCRKTIEVGEVYSYESGKYEGDFFVRKLCLDCFKILYEYFREYDEYEMDYDGIEYWLRDMCEDCKRKSECGIERPQTCELIKEKFKYKKGALCGACYLETAKDMVENEETVNPKPKEVKPQKLNHEWIIGKSV